MTTIDAGKALEIIRDVAYTTALTHRAEGKRVLADMIDAALSALPSPKVEGEPVAWRCFYCDEVFVDPAAAAEHFGTRWHSEPACQLDIAKYRAMEELHGRHLSEDSDADREFARLRSDHATALQREEEKGYERGMRDMRAELSSPSPVLAETVRYEIIDQTGCLHVTSDPVHAEKLRQALMSPVLADEGVTALVGLMKFELLDWNGTALPDDGPTRTYVSVGQLRQLLAFLPPPPALTP